MIHIFPYWDFSEGQLIDVRVCSNAPQIELFFNDQSMGTVNIDHKHGKKLLGEWQLPYSKGTLRAVAYDEHGVQIADDTVTSFGDSATVVMNPDKTQMTADGSDLVFVEISTLDQEGRPVENANNRIQISVEGPGRLVGLDNGDSTDYDSYKGTSRRMFSGKLLAVIASSLESGTIVVRASSHGLQSAELTLTSEARELDHSKDEELVLYQHSSQSLSDVSELSQNYLSDEIPVRKLEIICPQGNQLTKDTRSLPVRVQIHPENATYQEIEWRVTNAAGIDANIAVLEANGHEAVISALGDGDVYVRCATKNGADQVRLYSLMEFHIRDMGAAF